MASEALLQLDAVCRRYTSGGKSVDILSDLDLRLCRGERLAIMGSSGAGKSTLLHLAAGMDSPDSGRVLLAGQDLAAMGEPELSLHRARHVGLVFQDFNLIDSLTAGENIELALWLNRLDDDRDRVTSLATQLGIDALLDRLPEHLSGGERQRVAIARALVHRPSLVLADEPTGSLDERTADDVLTLFDQACRDTGCALVMVTHDRRAANICERIAHLRHGRLDHH